MPSRESVVIAGALAQKPHQGGHTWQFLQYILGFRRLGWDVLFIDHLRPEMCKDRRGLPAPLKQSENFRYFIEVMRHFGLEDDYALLCEPETIGQTRQAVLNRVRNSSFLLNVMGYLQDEELLSQAPLRVFLDTDPGYGQMWQALGLASLFVSHDRYVTIAENIGQDGCTIPACGIDWLTWRQPVVLDEWQLRPPNAQGAFTSIGAWRGPYGPLEFEGVTYGQRVHGFRDYISLPSRSQERFEAALDIDAGDAKDVRSLSEHGWQLVRPDVVTADPWTYRDYVGRAKAEFMIARNMYTRSRCGWFSERSICFLASGRPVLAQDTGLENIYSSGSGLILFDDFDDAVAGVESIRTDYERHSVAAREIAEAYFDSDKLIAQLIDKVSSKARREAT